MTGGKLKVLAIFHRMYRTCFAYIASAPLTLVNFLFGVNTISQMLVCSLTVWIYLLFSISGWMSGRDTESMKTIISILIH